MAKKLKAPIEFILNRIYNGKWGEDCKWNQDNFRSSLEQHPCDANNEILKALDGDDYDYLKFTIEHLIHLRCGYISQCYEFIKKARDIDWRT